MINQGISMKNFILKKIACNVKNRLHSRQQPCRSPRQTVIGIGLRNLFDKRLLAIGLSGSAAVPLPRVPPFLFYYTFLYRVYTSDTIDLNKERANPSSKEK